MDTVLEELTEDEILEETEETAEEPDEQPPVEVLDAPPTKNYDDMLDKYQRCLAEFDNYRKRTAKEMAARYDDGARSACEKLLPIVDNFERALAACDDKENNFYKGIEMIARQFINMLNEVGIKEIETEIGTAFNAHSHYAVAHTEDENFGENVVTEVLQKGYMHKERIMRPVMVKVAN